MNHMDVLAQAGNEARASGQKYGDVLPGMVRAANIASAILDRKVTAFEITVMQMAVNLSRLAYDRTNPDSWVNLVAHTAYSAQFAGPHTSDFQDIVSAQVEADLQEEVAKMASKLVSDSVSVPPANVDLAGLADMMNREDRKGGR